MSNMFYMSSGISKWLPEPNKSLYSIASVWAISFSRVGMTSLKLYSIERKNYDKE